MFDKTRIVFVCEHMVPWLKGVCYRRRAEWYRGRPGFDLEESVETKSFGLNPHNFLLGMGMLITPDFGYVCGTSVAFVVLAWSSSGCPFRTLITRSSIVSEGAK